MQNQVYVFVVFILNGFLIGIIFDCFRILRKSFKTPDFVTYIEDVLFGIITGLLILYSILKFNNGELRLFLFIGIFLGLLLYLLVFSKVFIKISVFIISTIKKIINYIILIPVKFICKLIRRIFFKPIIVVCFSLKKGVKKIKLSSFKIKKKTIEDVGSTTLVTTQKNK